MTQPWDRQPFDTDETFLWFVAYRDCIPPRRLDRIRVGQPGKVAPPLQQLLEWYNTGAWRERAEAWDKHIDTLKQGEREELVKREAKIAAVEELEIVKESRELLRRELDKMLRTSMSSETETLRVGELNKLMENVIKHGRLLRGESTEKTEVIDLSGLDLEDLRKLKALKEKASK